MQTHLYICYPLYHLSTIVLLYIIRFTIMTELEKRLIHLFHDTILEKILVVDFYYKNQKIFFCIETKNWK